MADAAQDYRRLPGRGVRRDGSWVAVNRSRCTVWEGPDHLLAVDSQAGYSEDYKRFYYRDIQALVVRRTDRYGVWLLAFGVLTLILGLLGWLVQEPAWRIFWLCLAAVFGLCLAVHAALGPTCICHLRTAVQTELLPSLGRLRSVRKFLARVRPRIEAAQGTLPLEQLRAPPPELASAPVVAPIPLGPARAAVAPAVPGEAYRGQYHGGLCALLLADAVRAVVDLQVDQLWVAVLELALWSGICFTLIAAMIRQHDPRFDPALRRWTRFVLAFVVSGLLLGYINYMLVAVGQPDTSSPLSQFEALRLYAQRSPWSSPRQLGVLLYSCAACLALGVAGGMLLRRFQGRRGASPVSR